MDGGDGRFQILCLSGGGYLGLYTACVLAGLEKASGQPLARRFDLIAGTSIGGIIALGLAAGRPAADIRDAFLREGPAIFGRPCSPLPRMARTLLGPLHSAAALSQTIDGVIGPDSRIGDLVCRAIIPTVNVTKGRPQVFKTPHHPSFVRDLHLPARDVALATSAAPVFFPLHRIGGELFADGGLYANSPDLLALHEAQHFLRRDIATLHMLSIGTTTAAFSFSAQRGPNLGLLGWARGMRFVRALLGAQQINTDAMAAHLLGPRYLRLDRATSAEQQQHLVLDRATPATSQELSGLAEATLRDALPDARLIEMLKHEAPAPEFF